MPRPYEAVARAIRQDAEIDVVPEKIRDQGRLAGAIRPSNHQEKRLRHADLRRDWPRVVVLRFSVWPGRGTFSPRTTRPEGSTLAKRATRPERMMLPDMARPFVCAVSAASLAACAPAFESSAADKSTALFFFCTMSTV